MARFIMIVVLSGMVTFGISSINQNTTINQGTQNVVDNFNANRAHDIATSMNDILMMRIANDVEYRVETDEVDPEDFDGGEVTYAVENTFFEGDSLIKITVAAEFNDVTKTITTYTDKTTDGWVPTVIRGAWTANGDLNNTISDMYIDGRDHDLDLNIIPTTGIHGITTSKPFVNEANAEIGGTNSFIDYPMTYPEVPEVIEENYNWGGGFPETPDEILGYPEGTLKAAAQTGLYGSQYLLNPGEWIGDPKNGDEITFPLSGITYVEITDGDERWFWTDELAGSGILVVHGPNASSKLGELVMDGTFTGLIVTDYSFHHHLDILGAMIMLSPDLETSQSCGGNADHWVYYSSEAIVGATEIAAEITGLSGQVGYGFGKKRVKVKYVYE